MFFFFYGTCCSTCSTIYYCKSSLKWKVIQNYDIKIVHVLLCMDLWITLHSSIITDICKTQQAMNKTFDKGLKKVDGSIVRDKQGLFFCFWNGTCVFESRKIIKILAIWEKILVYHNYELYWLVLNLNV